MAKKIKDEPGVKYTMGNAITMIDGSMIVIGTVSRTGQAITLNDVKDKKEVQVALDACDKFFRPGTNKKNST
jgi:hypothetical protein